MYIGKTTYSIPNVFLGNIKFYTVVISTYNYQGVLKLQWLKQPPLRKPNNANMRVYRDFFFSCIYNIYAQIIDGKYMSETPRRGGSNEYLKSMFWKIVRKIGKPLHTPVLLHKSR